MDGLVVEDEGLAEEGVEAGVALTGFAGLRAEGAMGEGEQGAEEAASGAGVGEGDGDGLKGPLEKRWDVGVLENGIQRLRDFWPWGRDLIVAGVSLRVGEEFCLAKGGGSGVLGVVHGVVSFL